MSQYSVPPVSFLRTTNQLSATEASILYERSRMWAMAFEQRKIIAFFTDYVIPLRTTILFSSSKQPSHRSNAENPPAAFPPCDFKTEMSGKEYRFLKSPMVKVASKCY